MLTRPILALAAAGVALCALVAPAASAGPSPSTVPHTLPRATTTTAAPSTTENPCAELGTGPVCTPPSSSVPPPSAVIAPNPGQPLIDVPPAPAPAARAVIATPTFTG